ncbi:hypothetical protein KUV85_00695 [Nocardioides panacisoli]|uniref:hypothetical protein n=1 Tax=Nocardioides panacisoli TaxID=627624 RepID=UPI001C633937|nr:hypothetical protein [Nocardioides panacisoli]QYJ04232.1 hypothetical protein KUV85_00695 [Nocardioides panacisoli]
MHLTTRRGRPRLTCSGRCRARRNRRRARSERDVLREFERLLSTEGTEEQWRTYADLLRSVPGFRETHDLALRRALAGERREETSPTGSNQSQ